MPKVEVEGLSSILGSGPVGFIQFPLGAVIKESEDGLSSILGREP